MIFSSQIILILLFSCVAAKPILSEFEVVLDLEVEKLWMQIQKNLGHQMNQIKVWNQIYQDQKDVNRRQEEANRAEDLAIRELRQAVRQLEAGQEQGKD